MKTSARPEPAPRSMGRHLSLALAGVVDALDAGDAIERLCRAVAGVIGSDSSSVIAFHRDGPPDILSVDYPAPVPAANEVYVRATYLLDPFHQAFLDGRADGLWLIADVVSGDFRKTAFFREYWRHLAQSDEVCFVARVGRDALCLSMARSRAVPPYSDAERRAMADAAPLIVALARRAGADALGRAPARTSATPSLDAAIEAFVDGRLTARERDVMGALMRGQPPKLSARTLGISPQTVRNHMKSVYAKLGVTTRAELFARFIGTIASGASGGPAP